MDPLKWKVGFYADWGAPLKAAALRFDDPGSGILMCGRVSLSESAAPLTRLSCLMPLSPSCPGSVLLGCGPCDQFEGSSGGVADCREEGEGFRNWFGFVRKTDKCTADRVPFAVSSQDSGGTDLCGGRSSLSL